MPITASAPAGEVTANLMERVGNIQKGKTPKYEELVDLSFANEAIKELGE